MKKNLYLLFLTIAIGTIGNSANAQLQKKSDEFQKHLIKHKSFIEEKKEQLKKNKRAALVYKAQKEGSDFWNETTQTWDSTGRVEYTYNTAGSVISETFYDVVFGPVVRNTYVYDQKEREIEQTVELSEQNKWVSLYRQNTTYENNLLTEQTFSNWDSLQNKWVYSSKNTYIYDAYNNIQRQTTSQFENNSWEIYSDIEFNKTYDVNGFVIAEELVAYNRDEMSWDTISRATYVRISNGELAQAIYKAKENNQWNYIQKEEYDYKPNGELSSIHTFLYNINTSAWDSSDRYIDFEWLNWTGKIETSIESNLVIQTYDGTRYNSLFKFESRYLDANGSKEDRQYDFDGIQWVPIDRTTRTYNSRGFYIELKYEEFLNNDFEITEQIRWDVSYHSNGEVSILEVHEFDFFTKALKPTSRYRFWDFASFQTGVNTQKSEIQLSTYPNPMLDQATIAFTILNKENVKIELIDLSGKRVQLITDQSFEKGKHQIKLTNVTSGMYLVKVLVGSKVYMDKIIAN